MDPHAVASELKDLAEKMGVTVSERVLANAPVHVQSGLCTVKGKPVLIIDRNLEVHDKIEILLDCICTMPYDDYYVVPFVRELISDYLKNRKVPFFSAE